MSKTVKGYGSGRDMGRMPMPSGTGILPVGLWPASQSCWEHTDITSNYTLIQPTFFVSPSRQKLLSRRLGLPYTDEHQAHLY
jgi:hypothetical protein